MTTLRSSNRQIHPKIIQIQNRSTQVTKQTNRANELQIQANVQIRNESPISKYHTEYLIHREDTSGQRHTKSLNVKQREFKVYLEKNFLTNNKNWIY